MNTVTHRKGFTLVELLTVIFIIGILASIIIPITSKAMAPRPATGQRADTMRQQEAGNTIQENQPTPTDIRYSLERYNLIRRAYWVNGQRARAIALPCPVPDVPLGYVVLLTESGSVVGRFVVEGKVSSLNSYLTPDSEYYAARTGVNGDSPANRWLADVDGCYGSNDNGIFFFTPDGKYIEWSGIYLYSDIPFEVKSPVVTVASPTK